MRASWLLIVFSLLIYLVTIPMCESFYTCVPCKSEEDCNKNPAAKCEFEETRNLCGYRVCKKGPDGRCGGRYGIAGVCGEGLICSFNRCKGCYVYGDGEVRCSDDNDIY